MRLSSYLTCNLVPRQQRGAVDDDPYDGPQPQTATCCTALQRGFHANGLQQPRYAPLRTPGSAALLHLPDQPPSSSSAVQQQSRAMTTNNTSCTTGRRNDKNDRNSKQVRKCKSTVDDVDVSQLIEGPRLRRSGGVRRDWSFEDLRANNAAA